MWSKEDHKTVMKQGDELYDIVFRHCQGRQYSAQAMIWGGIKMAAAGMATVVHMSGCHPMSHMQSAFQLFLDTFSTALALLKEEANDKTPTHH